MSQRHYISALLVAVLAGCAQDTSGDLPPKDDFYYPVAVEAVETTPGKPLLYVANSNFDLRYNRGTVLAVDTAALPEPPSGPVGAAVNAERGWAYIDSFAGQMGSAVLPDGTRRFFLPTRNAGKLYALDAAAAAPTLLACVTLPDEPAPEGNDCLDQGLVLENPLDTKVRAPDPFGVAIDGTSVYVTSLRQADDPVGSNLNRTSYIARLDAAQAFAPQSLGFIPVGLAPTQGVAVTPAGVYLTGRALAGTFSTSSQALRVIVDGVARDVGLTSATRVNEARGVALSSDRTRLYATTRSPDGLLVLDITTTPNRVLGFSTLPAGPDNLLVVPRAGRRDLVAVSCTGSDAVALYDDELGEPSGLVQGVVQPFGMAQASLPGNAEGKRLFVASFGNHTVDVIDIADLDRPRTARIVGRLGVGAHTPLGIDLPEGTR